MNKILYKYFFKHIDQGLQQDQTPLFSGIYNGQTLIAAVSIDFLELQEEEILELIEHAKQEVKL